MDISTKVCAHPTYKCYPRVQYFHERLLSLHERFHNILDVFTSNISNSNKVREIDQAVNTYEKPPRLVVHSNANLDMADSNEIIEKNRIDIVVIYIEIARTDTEGIRIAESVIKTMKTEDKDGRSYNIKNDNGTIMSERVFLWCKVEHKSEVDLPGLKKCLGSFLRGIFNLDGPCEDQIIISATETPLKTRISNFLEKSVVTIFEKVQSCLDEFLTSSDYVPVEGEIIEQEAVHESIQAFVGDKWKITDTLNHRETKSDTDKTNTSGMQAEERYLKYICEELTNVVKCSISRPLSDKFCLSVSICNDMIVGNSSKQKFIDALSTSTKSIMKRLFSFREHESDYEPPAKTDKHNYMVDRIRNDLSKPLKDIEKLMKSIRKQTDIMMGKMKFEIRAYLKQSILQRPKVQEESQESFLKMKKAILALDHVYGCGTVYGQFEIHLTQKEQGVEEEIKEVLQKHEYSKPYAVKVVKTMPIKFVNIFDENEKDIGSNEHHKSTESGEHSKGKEGGKHEKGKESGKHESLKDSGKQRKGKGSGEHDKGKESDKHEKGTVSGEYEKGKESDEHEKGKKSGEHEKGKESGDHGKGKESKEHEKGKESGEHGNGKESSEHGNGKGSGEHVKGKESGEHGNAKESSEHGNGKKSSEHVKGKENDERDKGKKRDNNKNGKERHERGKERGEHDKSKEGGEPEKGKENGKIDKGKESGNHGEGKESGKHEKSKEGGEQEKEKDSGEHEKGKETGEQGNWKDSGDHKNGKESSEHVKSKESGEHEKGKEGSNHENGKESSEYERGIDRGEHNKSKESGEHEKGKESGEHDNGKESGEHGKWKESGEHEIGKESGEYGNGRESSEHVKGKKSGEHEKGTESGNHENGKECGEHERGKDRAEHDKSKGSGEREKGKVICEYEKGKESGNYKNGKESGEHEKGKESGEHGNGKEIFVLIDNKRRRGTLGGFVEDEDSKELLAVTCAHVVRLEKNSPSDVEVFVDEGEQPRNFGVSTADLSLFPSEGKLIDMAAVRVVDEVRNRCCRMLKDENGKDSHSELVDMTELERYLGKDVYKYGAKTGRTSGIVCSVDFYLKMREKCGPDKPIIVIDELPGSSKIISAGGDGGACIYQRNPKPLEKFAAVGDSGAFVCLKNPKPLKVKDEITELSTKFEFSDDNAAPVSLKKSELFNNYEDRDDSGRTVGLKNSESETIKVLSVLIGGELHVEGDPDSHHLSFLLQAGLQEMSNKSGRELSLCTMQNVTGR